MSNNSKLTYAELDSEIEKVMLELARDDLDVDLAVKYYERGLTLVKQLEEYLVSAENKIIEVKAKFDIKK